VRLTELLTAVELGGGVPSPLTHEPHRETYHWAMAAGSSTSLCMSLPSKQLSSPPPLLPAGSTNLRSHVACLFPPL
jgi:hypothetical protein